MNPDGSARRHGRDLHSHDDAPLGEPARVLHSSGEDSAGETAAGSGMRLRREDGKLLYDCGDGNPVAVRLLWARPLSGRNGPLSVMLAAKKREVRYLESPDILDPESKRIALEELAEGMVLPRIERIVSVTPRFGNYYWQVETDRGSRTFLLTSPENNAIRLSPDAIVLKDALGNAFEINPISGLDRGSRLEFDRVF
ncbi:MAG: DUF1854 domain-containing protein [Planctomycetota bacterium]|jgi:hypothetical protein|nr:DUF1854 domain-containing protein [Planctomycetota bacterium]